MGFNAGLGMADSYYVASANPFPLRPALAGAETADLCVIGGGCTGLSAALHAAERGYSVILLEGGRIGWGASGRNGGQIIPGLRKGALDLVRLYGRPRARVLFDLAIEARALVVDLIQRYEMACDLKTTGHLQTAVGPADLDHMKAEAECLAEVMAYPGVEILDRGEAQHAVRSSYYVGGLLDRAGGHLHPLNYTTALAEAAERAGARLFEHSAALRLGATGGVTVTTAAGSVRARHAVLACDALLGGLEPRIAGRIMPVANYIVATEPLDEPVIPDDYAVSDSRFIVNYFRQSADQRLLFGGGERYSPNPPGDIVGFVRKFMLRVFPQLAGRRIDYGWGGMVSVTTTRLPHFGRLGETFYAHGYSGQGVVLSTLAGKLIAEAMAGTAERFDLFAGIAPPAFPGGTALRYPLHVLGMLWYALRDRL